MNQDEVIFDVNEYLDYETGEYIDPDYDILNAAVQYNMGLAGIMEKYFLSRPVPNASGETADCPAGENGKTTAVSVDNVCAGYYIFHIHAEEKYLYHGSYEVFVHISEAQNRCDDERTNQLLDELKCCLDKLLLLSVTTDADKVDEVLGNISELGQLLRGCHKQYCLSGSNERLGQLVRLILQTLPYREHCSGCYDSRSIHIYTKSVAALSDSRESFNCLFWSTFAHEMFHFLHHRYCCKFNTEHGHWERDDSSFRKGSQDDSSFWKEQCHDTEIRNIFDQGFPSIVKESLASYFEYYSCLYGANSSVSGAKDAAARLHDKWMKHSPLDWAYAGAKAFLTDEDNILAPDSLFRTVLNASAHDWYKALAMILSQC